MLGHDALIEFFCTSNVIYAHFKFNNIILVIRYNVINPRLTK